MRSILIKIDGVKKVIIHKNKNIATIEFDENKVSVEELKNIIIKSGFKIFY